MSAYFFFFSKKMQKKAKYYIILHEILHTVTVNTNTTEITMSYNLNKYFFPTNGVLKMCRWKGSVDPEWQIRLVLGAV